MPPPEKIKTRCPMCQTTYRVPNTQIGHRARCPKCDSVFRVTVPTLPTEDRRRPHVPTDDEILAWLNEAAERDDDLPAGPRRWESAAPSPSPSPPAPASNPPRPAPAAKPGQPQVQHP